MERALRSKQKISEADIPASEGRRFRPVGGLRSSSVRPTAAPNGYPNEDAHLRNRRCDVRHFARQSGDIPRPSSGLLHRLLGGPGVWRAVLGGRVARPHRRVGGWDGGGRCRGSRRSGWGSRRLVRNGQLGRWRRQWESLSSRSSAWSSWSSRSYSGSNTGVPAAHSASHESAGLAVPVTPLVPGRGRCASGLRSSSLTSGRRCRGGGCARRRRAGSPARSRP